MPATGERVRVDVVLQPGAVSENVTVTQDASLLRAEVFNLTNTPPLAAPNTLLGPGLGSITSAGDPRVIQLGIKLNF